MIDLVIDEVMRRNRNNWGTFFNQVWGEGGRILKKRALGILCFIFYRLNILHFKHQKMRKETKNQREKERNRERNKKEKKYKHILHFVWIWRKVRKNSQQTNSLKKYSFISDDWQQPCGTLFCFWNYVRLNSLWLIYFAWMRSWNEREREKKKEKKMNA